MRCVRVEASKGRGSSTEDSGGGSLVSGTVGLGKALEGEPLNERLWRESLATSTAVLQTSWHQRWGLTEVGSGGGARREEMKVA